MEITKNEYGEPVYDKENFDIKTMDELVVGDIVLIKQNVAKILSKSKSFPGKHGYSKVYIKCVGLFDDKLYEEMTRSECNILIPKIHYNILNFNN